MIRRRLLAPLVACLFPLAAVAEPLELTATPIGNFALHGSETRFGTLDFLGGLELQSSDRRFSGLSGLAVTDGGTRVLTESDDGYLVRGTLRYSGGRLVGLDDAEIDRMFPGETTAKGENDVEDIALDPTDPSRGAIVMERRADALMRFTSVDGLPAGFAAVAVPADPEVLRSNKGLESVAIAPPPSPAAGHIVVIAEVAPRSQPDRIPGWIVGLGAFAIVARDGFDISSAAFLSDGDLVILERRYSPAVGVAMRLRRIAADSVRPGATLDGEELMAAGMGEQIDNMEGLAVHTDEAGRIVLTLVSDDNRSILQRTLLLQFALTGR